MLMNDQDIIITKPKTDCRFIRLFNFVDSDGNDVDSQYAMCANSNKTRGLTFIDIVLDPEQLLWETSCKDCMYYDSSSQLLLF